MPTVTTFHKYDKLDQNFKHYKSAKKNAAVWRDNFMELLAEARSEKNGTSTELEMKKLK
jgi:tRNA U34 5-methylaminomethyl-2-thiouridine-forming methyltransferase MnmC